MPPDQQHILIHRENEKTTDTELLRRAALLDEREQLIRRLARIDTMLANMRPTLEEE